jgi:hypothetical protein
VEVCPSSTYPNSSKGACLDLVDLSSEHNPAQYTVGAQGYFGGETLKEVLEKLWMRYNEVLLPESLYALGTSTDDKSLTIQASVKLIRIKAVCPSEVICTAEVKLMSPYLVLSGDFDLELKSLELEGKYALDNACVDSDSCTYCPYLLEQDGLYYDDRFNIYEVRPNWPRCSYAELSLIKAKQVTLTAVSFKNCRQGYRALIEASESLSLTQVTFDNVSVAGKAGAAVVRLSCSSDNCSFAYKGGSVTRLNNGYELLKSTIQAGFLSLIKARSIELHDISFSLSSVYQGSSEADSPPLIYIENCKGTSTLEQLSIDSLVLSSGLVVVKATDVQYPADQTVRARWRLLAAAHIHLKDISVTSSSCRFLLLVKFGDYLQNIALEGLTISQTAIGSTAIEVTKPDFPSREEINGGVTAYKTQYFEATLKDRNYFSLARCTFMETYWMDSLVKLTHLANIAVQDVLVVKSGSFYGGLQEFAYEQLRAHTDVYAEKTLTWPVALECLSAFSLLSASVGSFAGVEFREGRCSGVFGLKVEYFQGAVSYKQLSISDWRFFDVTLQSLSGSLMNLAAMQQADLSLERVHAESITNDYGRGGIVVKDGSLTIKNSKFKQIRSLDTGGLLLELIDQIQLENLEFEDVSSRMYGACINIYSSDKVGLLSVLNSKFLRCSSDLSGGALFIDYTHLSIELIIRDSFFISNKASISGSAIYLTYSVHLQASSIVDSCEFTDNFAGKQGVIDFTLNSSMTLSNLKFSYNTGGLSTCRIIHNKASLTVVMKAVEFVGNSADNILWLEGLNSQSVFDLQNCALEGNTGYTGYMQQTALIFTDLRIYRNSDPFSFVNVQATGKEMDVIENSSEGNASAFQIFNDSELSCSSCRFLRNQGLVGTIRVDSSSLINCESCDFSENASSEAASVLYIVNSIRANTLKNTSVTLNKTQLSWTIQLIRSRLVLDAVVFKHNSALSASAGVLIQTSFLEVNNCAFFGQSGRNGVFLMAIANTVLNVTKSSFRQGSSLQGGGVASVSNSKLTMSECEISDISSEADGAIDAYLGVEVSITKTSFTRVRTGSRGAAVSVYSGKLVLTEVSVTDFQSTALYAAEMTEVSLQRVTVSCKD